MYLDDSEISCGIKQLVSIEDGDDEYGDNGEELTLEAQYRRTMCDAHCALVIASLTTDQTKGIELLKKHGFKAVNRPRTNPNSGNKIILFVKQMKSKKAKKAKVSRDSYANANYITGTMWK